MHLNPSSRTSRQTRQLLAKVVSSQRSSHPGSRVAFLAGDFVSGTFHPIPFNGQTHPARNRLRRLGVEHHAIEKPFRNVERLLHLFSRFHFLWHESKGRNLVLRALSGPPPRPSPAPALSEARCLVVPNGNHVRVGTLEAPPICKSNVAPA